MSLLLPSCRPLLRSLPRSLYLTSTAMISRSLPIRSLQTPSSTSSKTPPKFAFAFDIDGVLLHGSTPTENATKALSHLSKNAIEFILLTNGGGKTESARTAELSNLLNFPIQPEQFIQSHTPFKQLASDPTLGTVLIVGGEADNCRYVAKEYGFKNVILPCDILAAYPSISPFSVNKNPEYAQPLPEGEIKFDAILVFNDPRDWALDIQIITDILLSDQGRLGTRRTQKSPARPIPLYFSNPDLIWANEYHLPRFAQAGFRSAFVGAWQALRRVSRGVPKPSYKTFGKPNKATYEFAEELLCEWRKKQLKVAEVEEQCADVETVYMVGDNPRSDITGANRFRSEKGVRWVSVLVKTGVYRDGDDPLKAKAIVGDVLDAVNWAIAREERKALGDEEVLKEEEEWEAALKVEEAEHEENIKWSQNKKKPQYRWIKVKSKKTEEEKSKVEGKPGEEGKPLLENSKEGNKQLEEAEKTL